MAVNEGTDETTTQPDIDDNWKQKTVFGKPARNRKSMASFFANQQINQPTFHRWFKWN